MNEPSKRLLWTYITELEPHWQATDFDKMIETGLYRFAPYSFSVVLKEGPQVQSYNGYDWKANSKASWEFVQKIVDSHRAGKRGYELVKGLCRKTFTPIWE